ncbi:hypothetical protein HYH02_008210 [Chlamydomonas schloesseri]|uniref:VTT domain-containing protein n=1 Tax=Chlamydomonas schloesseri TaxID=2026947 RepID=A0A835WFR6_9CHLO|nr:hypothetical protein HYH02_008210 [Chlamydomonas schloesseri]|eukprot:KAG2446638.1 hypothetical protein HYH02_008210 [Chlamydomonas schloesseri]
MTSGPEPFRVKFAPGDSSLDSPGAPAKADANALRSAWGQQEPGLPPVLSAIETVLSAFVETDSGSSSACSSRSCSSKSLTPGDGGVAAVAGEGPTTSTRGAAEPGLRSDGTGTRAPAGWRSSASGAPSASAAYERSKNDSRQQLAVPLLAAATPPGQGPQLGRASLQLETPLLATASRHSQAGDLARASKGSATSHHHRHHHRHSQAGRDAEGGGADAGAAAADGAVKKRTWMGRVSPWICMPNRKAKWITFVLFWAVVGGGVVYLLLWGFTKLVDEVIEPTTQLAHDNLKNWQFALVLCCCMIVLPLVFIPPLPFIWVTAMLFNMWVAFGIVQAAVTASMALGYLVARRWLQRPARRFLDRYRHVKSVLEAVDAAGPFRVALLVRLGPLPFTVENFVMAVPHSLTFLPYITGSILGQLPGNLLACYFGKNLKGLSSMMKGESTSPGQIAYNIGGLLLSIGLVVLGFWFARRAMRKIEREQEEARKAKEEADKAVAEGVAEGAAGTGGEERPDGAGGEAAGLEAKKLTGAVDGLTGVGSVRLTEVQSVRLQQQPSAADAPSLYPWGGGGGAGAGGGSTGAVSPAAALAGGASAAAPSTLFLSTGGGGGGGGLSAAASGASGWRSAASSSVATNSGSTALSATTTAQLTNSTSGRHTSSSNSAAATAAAAAATPFDTASATAGMPTGTSVAMAAAAGAFGAGAALYSPGCGPTSPVSNLHSREHTSPLTNRRVSELRISRAAAAASAAAASTGGGGGGGGRLTPPGASATGFGSGSVPASPRMPTMRTHSVASVGGVLLGIDDGGDDDIDVVALDPFGVAAGTDPDHPSHQLTREYAQRTSLDSECSVGAGTRGAGGSAGVRGQGYSVRQNALYNGGGSMADGAGSEGDGDSGPGGSRGRGGSGGRAARSQAALGQPVSRMYSGLGGTSGGGGGGGGVDGGGLVAGSVSALLHGVVPRAASFRDLNVRRAAITDEVGDAAAAAPLPPPRGASSLEGGCAAAGGMRNSRPSSRRNSVLQGAAGAGGGWSAVGAGGNAAVAAAPYEELVVPPSPLRNNSRRTASVVGGAGAVGAPRRLSNCGLKSEGVGAYGDPAVTAAAAAAMASASVGGTRNAHASGAATRPVNSAAQETEFAGFGTGGGPASPLGMPVPDQGPRSAGGWGRHGSGLAPGAGPLDLSQQQLQQQQLTQQAQQLVAQQQQAARGSRDDDSLPNTPTRRSPLGVAAVAAVRSGAYVRPGS